MSKVSESPFLMFLEKGIQHGGFESDDVLSAILPLMRQTLRAHEAGHVAPLKGVLELTLTEQGHLAFDPAKAIAPGKAAGRLAELQAPISHAVEVVGESRRTADIDAASVTIANLDVSRGGEELKKPVYLTDYVCWEHAIGHHDALTDIYSLGLLLVSMACGLNFTEPDDLEIFVSKRENLFALKERLHPVIASVSVQMTELNRHKRAQDLGQLIHRLENYREQPGELDLSRLKGFKESSLTGKRRLIQAHLRDRLFEISRRNRLIHFKPTLHTLNLTVASVPILLDYRNIKLEQLFVWHPELAARIAEGSPMPLGKYLRFEDSPYIPGVLDKIISEARRDRAEYGFAQLRLVLCFLRWHNLKEAPQERIHSPLLLLPVELKKKKGVRDNYTLDPSTTEAEVNPALRHHLKELYNLNLPESVDLRETTLDQFCEGLQAQIRGSEPGVTLNKIDRPQIELIHERARQRVDQYRRRMKVRGRPARNDAAVDYSYERESLRPLGLQLFLQKVRPTPAPLREVAGAPPKPRLPHIVEPEPDSGDGKVLETERRMFALRGGENQNPYSWDFDLCSLTLGNFNYRKMTLVRDYSNLIETDMASGAFDTIFSLVPKAPEEPMPPPLELAAQHLIISCDATQSSAVARARTGKSYIIQGPPGTGKSQTITNLIADYVARGKRVLFVCAKRAAIDIVFHRLRQQGLNELCCLIHDSQTDKKEFIQNLKQTYEEFLSHDGNEEKTESARTAIIAAMEQELASLLRFSDAMRETYQAVGIPLRTLLHRLVDICGRYSPTKPEVEEQLPDYPVWLQHGEMINRLQATLKELGEETCFAQHPTRWLGKGILQAERPLEMLSGCLEKAESLLDSIESALELSGLPASSWDTLEEVQTILEFAVKVQPLAERGLLGLLDPRSKISNDYATLAAELDEKARVYWEAHEKTAGWKDPLSPDDAQNALLQARGFEKSIFSLLQPAYWRLRKTLRSRYDFAGHAVAPSWVKVLEELATLQQSLAAYETSRAGAEKSWSSNDLDQFRKLVADLRALPELSHPSVKAFMKTWADSAEPQELVNRLVGIHGSFAQFTAALDSLLVEHKSFDLPGLSQTLASLRDQTSLLPDLLPVLTELAELPDRLARALRHAPLRLDEFEGAIGGRSLNQIYRQDRGLSRFEGRVLEQRMARLEKFHREWLGQNAVSIRARVRQNFLEHVNVSSLPASQLTVDQKIFKKSFAAGRRDLEHEFGKTMRYRSIRDLAADATGSVIQDLKPIWLMSPLSVSDTLPLDPKLFDVVIFDEASQIPLEEAIPALYRSNQVIVVGDEMQLPPTTFFASSRSEEETVIVEEEGERIAVGLDADSFLTQSATNLPSTLLAWHYRSRYESLISFSNAAFYGGNLFTIPDRQRAISGRAELIVNTAEHGGEHAGALLERSISFHFMENGVYAERRNASEAAYIACLVRGLFERGTKLSIGIVAFSEAQQTEIEDALGRLAEEDAEFAQRLEAEFIREEDDQFCGLFVKNLENVQGDERDIMILSICYGQDEGGRMLMNFGPINQRGGEKRLNVIFSRAKHHMAVVSSIRHGKITNDYNDGANSLKSFLQYAEAISKGDAAGAGRVLESLNPLKRKSAAFETTRDAVIEAVAKGLRARGYAAELNVGQSKFRCDIAVRAESAEFHQLAVLVDTQGHYANPNLLDRYLMQPSILRAFGWQFALVLTKDWFHDPKDVLNRLERVLKGQLGTEQASAIDSQDDEPEIGAETGTPAFMATKPTKVEPKPDVAPTGGVGGDFKPGVDKGSPEGIVRHFECTSGGSQKFWEITLAGNAFTVRFGRIGTSGQSQSKTFADPAKAAREMELLISEKVKKGYVEKNPSI